MAEWETVTVLRKKPPKASAMKSEQVISIMTKILQTDFKISALSFRQLMQLEDKALLSTLNPNVRLNYQTKYRNDHFRLFFYTPWLI